LKISETLEERDKTPEDILTLEEKEKEYILKVLTLTEGKIYGPGGAAEVLNVNPSTLRARLKKLGINKKITF
jgi:transcriptional regulator with GAF, ATPase, and Fis domain